MPTEQKQRRRNTSRTPPPDDDMIEIPEEDESDAANDVDIPTDIPAEASATAPDPVREG